jgi:hypothetical protein
MEGSVEKGQSQLDTDREHWSTSDSLCGAAFIGRANGARCFGREEIAAEGRNADHGHDHTPSHEKEPSCVEQIPITHDNSNPFRSKCCKSTQSPRGRGCLGTIQASPAPDKELLGKFFPPQNLIAREQQAEPAACVAACGLRG